jgi:RNA polymerase sigma-70 factor (ECF subfamily)
VDRKAREVDPQQLIDRAKQGDASAAAELLETYRNYLRLLARIHLDRSVQAKVDPSDLVQETLLRAAGHISQWRGNSEPELIAWLRRIMANTSAKTMAQYTQTRRRNIGLERQMTASLDRSGRVLEQLASPLTSPSQRAIRREATVLLANRLAELPDDYRQAIVWHHLEGLSIAEVAERMGRSAASTNSLLARALLKLRRLMKEMP